MIRHAVITLAVLALMSGPSVRGGLHVHALDEHQDQSHQHGLAAHHHAVGASVHTEGPRLGADQAPPEIIRIAAPQASAPAANDLDVEPAEIGLLNLLGWSSARVALEETRSHGPPSARQHSLRGPPSI